MNWLFGSHDRSQELKDAAPPEVRIASHDYANETMKVEKKLQTTGKQADAFTELVRRMREDGKCR